MDLLASAMLVCAFGLSLASFVLLCFLWIKVNRTATENSYLAMRNSDLARSLARLQDEVHTTGRIESIPPVEGARERARRTQKLHEREQEGEL